MASFIVGQQYLSVTVGWGGMRNSTKVKKTKSSEAPPKSRKNAGKKIKDDDLFVVGIGASAGGLESLRPLVSCLPALTNMAYVVVQHLSPQYRSMLGQILGRDTQLTITEITDNLEIERNHIYITPPNKDVVISKGRLRLLKPSAPVGPKPSVDAFLVSLAEDKGEYAIGVILSGTGTDGAHGMRAVKAHSGFTIVQDPDTAKYDGMPKAAIQTGCVDRLMPPDKIGQELASIAQFPRLIAQKSAATASHDALDEILIALRRRTDIDFTQYKQNTLCRRLERRMAANRIETLEKYLTYIQDEQQELDYLCKDILISVTSFFRDKQAFQELGKIFGRIFQEKRPGDSIRIWIPGCATGEEAYSLAMMLCDHFGKAIKDYTIQIFATDIDMDAMAHARKGLYSEETVKSLERGFIDRYFDAIGQSFQVKKTIREMVVFARQDLTKDPPFVRVDLISCRNVLIYFNAELQNRVLSVFHYALNPGGFLFLGKSESIGGHTDAFKAINQPSKVFAKRMNFDYSTAPSFGLFRPKYSPEKVTKQVVAKKKSIQELMGETFIDAYAPDSVVVNDNFDVLHFHENVETFVKLPRGTPNLNLSKLIIDDFRSDLRVLLHRVRKEGNAVYGLKKRLEMQGQPTLARLVVRLLPTVSSPPGKDDEVLYLVSCETEPLHGDEINHPRMSAEEDAELRISELEQELTATRENLQTVVEELETSNEELQALNEELQAANEELQSSNEELETSNEELQSTNEELTTVNQELQVRSAELIEANTDLENIQHNIGFPMIVVDKHLRISRYTPQAIRLFGIAPTDIGQVITSVPTYADLAEMRQHLNEVILSGKPFEDEIRCEGSIFRMRIVPYRDQDKLVGGAILTFIDETEVRHTKELLQQNELWVRRITDSIPTMIYYLDSDQKIRFCNQPFADFFKTSIEEALGKTMKQVVGVKSYKVLQPYLDQTEKGVGKKLEHQEKNARGEPVFLQTQLEPHLDDQGNLIGQFIIVSDISDMKMTEAELMAAKEAAENANQAKSNFLASMSHELRTPLNAILAFSEMIELEKFGPLANDKYREYAQDIHASGGHLLKMIGEILDLSKVEAHMVELEEKNLEISEVFKSSARFVYERAETGDVKLRLDAPKDIPRIRADETMLKRIILNLLTNAVKFTPPGGQVSVSANTDGDTFNIVVVDTGIGIPPKDIERILKPFEQVKRATQADNREGVGLGLSITKSLVDLHGGTLDLSSELGKGTIVTVSFPKDRIAS